MSNPVILKKNEAAIEWASCDLRDELEQMQGWIDWFNSLNYTQPIIDLATAKEFLSDTKAYHDREVEKFLRTKTPELPPNLQPMREAWQISDCDQVNFSANNPRFTSLEMVNGKLQYPQSVYDEIERKNTIVATPEQVQALQELDQLYDNLMALRPLLHPTPGMTWQLYESDVNALLSDFFYKKHTGGQHDGTLVRWKIPVIEALANLGFGQPKNKV